jgi:hypothetical protein
MTDIKERLRLVAQSPRSDAQLAKDALAEIERLEDALADAHHPMLKFLENPGSMISCWFDGKNFHFSEVTPQQYFVEPFDAAIAQQDKRE